MLGYNLITKQTPKAGLTVNCVLVEESVVIKKEYYVAILLDRANSMPAIIHSKFGGMDIEEVPKKDIHVCFIEPKTGIT